MNLHKSHRAAGPFEHFLKLPAVVEKCLELGNARVLHGHDLVAPLRKLRLPGGHGREAAAEKRLWQWLFASGALIISFLDAAIAPDTHVKGARVLAGLDEGFRHLFITDGALALVRGHSSRAAGPLSVANAGQWPVLGSPRYKPHPLEKSKKMNPTGMGF